VAIQGCERKFPRARAAAGRIRSGNGQVVGCGAACLGMLWTAKHHNKFGLNVNHKGSPARASTLRTAPRSLARMGSGGHGWLRSRARIDVGAAPRLRGSVRGWAGRAWNSEPL